MNREDLLRRFPPWARSLLLVNPEAAPGDFWPSTYGFGTHYLYRCRNCSQLSGSLNAVPQECPHCESGKEPTTFFSERALELFT